ncbi:MAG: 16S rRNA (adenine(1518)-N(6)/adenine(1519)-N(6))-dimethyltransferase RsmA [Kiritimatiellia bacterium]
MTEVERFDDASFAMRAFTRPSVIRAWLQDADIRPNRLLGQNFLIDGNILTILLTAADICPADRVLEVGPGVGALTAGLVDAEAYVVAIEKDARLLPLLAAHLPVGERLKILCGDALDLVEDVLARERINKFVANLPYTPGTRILVDVVTSTRRPAQIAVMVQDEVARRITALPGTTDFGLLGLWCRNFYDVSYVKRVSPNCFWPRPQVQSAIVALRRRETPSIPEAGWPFFRHLTRQLFQQRRKQMGHLLTVLYPQASDRGKMAFALLPEIYRHLRPEALPLDVWYALSENMRMHFEHEKAMLDGEEGADHGW